MSYVPFSQTISKICKALLKNSVADPRGGQVVVIGQPCSDHELLPYTNYRLFNITSALPVVRGLVKIGALKQESARDDPQMLRFYHEQAGCFRNQGSRRILYIIKNRKMLLDLSQRPLATINEWSAFVETGGTFRKEPQRTVSLKDAITVIAQEIEKASNSHAMYIRLMHRIYRHTKL